MKSSRTRTVVLATALAVPLALGGIGPTALAEGVPASSPSPSGSAGPFGPECAKLPNGGKGGDMARQKVADAVAQSPQLTELASALRQAGLTGPLNDAKEITLFAPDNEAFQDLTAAEREALFNNPDQLKRVLNYHVVEKKITRDDLPNGSFTTREGSKLTTSGSGDRFEVNNEADIECGGVRVANATIEVIDEILMPPPASPSPSPSP
ncbi:fasciclin domain-containing protein [Streptomyces sp. NPDC057638]|uniref:fasciclin domain-containing protein n=1 Tax=Streptomyces sp. NPDC057638 TaxID=3346190 RepID=UPI0036C73D58